ncbi:TfoX/Sxy family protein [Aquimarina sp. AU474]|uniref:TfoX/Sxy family protein n=1 Tax=Aquimarina sp. AU474 TaxID=2108529 RepID=UPI000D69CF3B|nr:TfoX/Sxy family protein [Aquimarina sp. AU474]
MAYNEFIADRIRQIFKEKRAKFYEKKMMGGLCFMVDNKMCCGIHFDKKKEMDLLMARIGVHAVDEAMKKEGCLPMDFTGRPMKGYVFVTPDGFDLDKDLEYWIQLCLTFNPLAKSSKKK